MSEFIVRVPADVAGDFQVFWKDLRVAEALDQDIDLGEPILSDNFDGAAVAAWVVSISPYIAPVITAVFGYLVAKRGELEIQKGDTTIRMKNLKPSQLKEFLAAIDDHL
ncbi:hypothetical protein [uncultured Roseobacter sp.]|uniref:hypothetical protein n=1 Tax=uncultured Roseobacter sp. TaxID=114847 RepID=UPI0026123049|nr:hypothetical protein [uncultured Roseobacter sp.]